MRISTQKKKWMFFRRYLYSSERYCGIRRHFVYCILSLDQEIYVSLSAMRSFDVFLRVSYIKACEIINCKMLITLYEFSEIPTSIAIIRQLYSFFWLCMCICRCNWVFFPSFRVLFYSVQCFQFLDIALMPILWLCFITGPTNL